MLFKMLLEPSLPVAELLSSTDELLLKRLLFDVALDLGSFLNYDTSPWLSDVQYKDIAILWLLVTNSALQFASENGDQAGVNCYMKGFSASHLPQHIISWVTGGTNMKPITPDISSLKDLIGWLLVLEKQGLKLCDNGVKMEIVWLRMLPYVSMGEGNATPWGSRAMYKSVSRLQSVVMRIRAMAVSVVKMKSETRFPIRKWRIWSGEASSVLVVVQCAKSVY